jgi:hypothetical protein
MKVSVKFDPSFDRIPHPDASLEESIDEVICPVMYVFAL